MSTTTSTPARASGISAPLGVISHTDQSGLIAIITAISLCFVLVSLSVHIYVRYSGKRWKVDDSVLLAGAFIACLQSALVFFEVHKGLGKVASLLDPGNEVDIQKTYFANNILYIVVLCLSKTSMGFLYIRLTRMVEHVRVVYVILGACIVWGVMSIPLICIDCSWRTGCSSLYARWLSIGVLDCLTDTALVLMSVYLVSGLQVSLGQKSVVVGAFATRLLLIPACAVRLYHLNPSTLSSNRNLAQSLVVVCTQLQLSYSIMTSSISSFKPFITVYETNLNPTNRYYPRHASYGNNTAYGEAKDSFKLDSLNSPTNHHTNNSVLGAKPTAAPPVPNSRGGYLATVSSHDKSSHHKKNSSEDYDEKSVRSHDSRQMIIERSTAWSVHDEDDDTANEIGRNEGFEMSNSYQHIGTAI